MEIELGPFYKGAACGAEVNIAHQDVEFTDLAQRTAFFWLAVGMLAVSKYGITSLTDENVEFFTGAATQAPSVDTETSDEDESVSP